MTFKLVENFETHTPDRTVSGQAAADGKTWATLGSEGVEEMYRVVSPEGNKVLWCNPAYQQRAGLPLPEPLLPGRAGTLFFRVRYAPPTSAFFTSG